MVQGISGSYGAYGAYGAYSSYQSGNLARTAFSSGGGPVNRIDPVTRASASTPPVVLQAAAKEPAAAAQPLAPGATKAANAEATPAARDMFVIPDAADNKYTAAEMAVRGRIIPFEPQPAMEKNQPVKAEGEDALKTGGMEELAEDTECQTCKERKYQDESGDSTVSFQNPQSIDPSVVASTVRGHEMEHVSHEQAKAQREDRKVVSQSVVLHSAICPDCGETYISGGTTRTVTMANDKPEPVQPEEEAEGDPFLANMKFPA